jgi:hypothetical protein
VWIDITIAALLTIVMIVMAYLGVHVTLHPADSPRSKRLYKGGFILCAFIAVALVFWQGVRNGKAQAALQRTVGDAASAARLDGQRIDRLMQEQKEEVARREQAEKDLALIIQATGQSTRSGVVTDLKKSPITVQVGRETKIKPEEEKKYAAGIEKFITEGISIQQYWLSSDDLTGTKAKWLKWRDETYKSLQEIGPSYAVQFAQAHGNAFMGCPAGRNAEGCTYWQDIEGKNDALSSILGELRHGR